MRRVLEAILFLADEPQTAATLAQVVELPRREVELLLAELAQEFEDRRAGLALRGMAHLYPPRRVAHCRAVRAVVPACPAHQGRARDPGHRGLQAAGHPPSDR